MEKAKDLLIHQLKIISVDWEHQALLYKEKNEKECLTVVSDNIKKLRKLILDIEDEK